MLDWLAAFHRRGWAVTQLHGIDDLGNCTCGRTDDKHRKQAGKHPTRAGWESHGLTDWPTIEAVWSAQPRSNVGIVTGMPSGVWVLDVDLIGQAGLAELEAVHGTLPATYEVKTGSGGRHLYWAMPADGSDLGNGTGSLPPGVDVRGTGGQVVAPGSTSGLGPYVEANAIAPIEAPAWLVTVIRTPKVRAPVAPVYDGQGYELAGPMTSAAESSRVRAYVTSAVRAELDRAHRAVEGQRNAECFAAACSLVELAQAPWSGLSLDDTWGAFWHAAATAANPLDSGELIEIWGKARARVGSKTRDYPHVDAGGLAFQAPALTLSATLPHQREPAVIEGSVVAEVAPQRAGLRGLLMTTAQLRTLPPLEPLIDDILEIDALAWIIGKPGSGKSFVALDMAMAIATGRPWHGHAVRKGSVIYLAAEGGRGISPRVDAIMIHYGLTDADTEGFLCLPLPVEARDPAAWEELAAVCREIQPALIVLDTQARVTVGLKENDNTEMGLFVAACEYLRRAAGSAVILVHHMNAAGESRGASALLGAAQTELSVSKVGDDDRAAITVKTTKQKDMAEADPVELRFHPIREAGPRGSVMLVSAKADRLSLEAQAARVAAAELADTDAMTLLAAVMGETFAEGRGGTKAEVRSIWLPEAKRRGMFTSASGGSSMFYRTWNRASDLGMIRRVSGSQSWRWVPADDRAGIRADSNEL